MKSVVIGISILLAGCLICGLANLGSSGGNFFLGVAILGYAAISIGSLVVYSIEKNTTPSPNKGVDVTTLSPLQSNQSQAIQTQKQKPVKSEDAILARETVLGENHPPTGRYVKVKDKDRQSGMYVIGVQGVGKSSLLENIIYQDIRKGYAVIVLDPHGDLVEHVIAQMPEERIKDTYVLSIEDTDYPFGVNLFSIAKDASNIQQAQALDRVLHVFEKCFPETSRMLLEKYLGNIAPVFFAHAEVGYAMTDIPTFLREEAFRAKLIKNTRLFIRKFWQDEYASMSPSVQRSETASLATRLNRFLRSPIVGNIIGQSRTTIDFRKAIENKEIILIKLPVKTLQEDASLIGTMLVAQIYTAIFSFSDTELEKRPGFSLFVDEFQHFATSDFAEMFTEGRKFGSRVTVAHQFRSQLLGYLASATMTAQTIMTFRSTREDAPEMAYLYPAQETLRPETIPIDVINYLLNHHHPNEAVSELTRYLSAAVDTWKNRKQLIKIKEKPSYISMDEFLKRTDFTNGLYALNDVLYRCMRDKRSDFPLPPRAVHAFLFILGLDDGVQPFVNYDPNPTTASYIFMGVQADSSFSCKADFENLCAAPTPDELSKVLDRLEERLSEKKNDLLEEAADFIACLRFTMEELAANPLGEKDSASNSEVAAQIINLPRGHAFVKVGNEVSEIETLSTPKRTMAAKVRVRNERIIEQTRKKYCRPALEVEEEIQTRLELVQHSQEASETQEKVTIEQPEEKQNWQPFDEV